MTMNLRTLTRGASTLTVALAALCLLAGTGLAYWTTAGNGSGQAATATFGAPVDPQPMAATTTSVTLDWGAPDGVQPTDYTVTADGANVPSCAVTETECTATGLASARTYAFIVTSRIDDSWSAEAPFVNGTTLTPAPTVATPTVTIDTLGTNDTLVPINTNITGTSSATNTVNIVITTAGETNRTGTATPTGSGAAKTWSATPSAALSYSKTYTVTATSTNVGGTGTTSRNFTTAAGPSALASVTVTNGAGAGSAYVNNTTKGSVGLLATFTSAAQSGDLVRFSLSGTKSGSAATEFGSWLAVPAGSTTHSGTAVATAFDDGALTVTAQLQNPGFGGGILDSKSTTTTKDVAGPKMSTMSSTVTGTAPGRAQTADNLVVNFNEPVNGIVTGSQQMVICTQNNCDPNPGGGNSKITIAGLTSTGTGSTGIAAGTGYIASNSTLTVNGGTLTLSTDRRTATYIVGTVASPGTSTALAVTLTFNPAAVITDDAGNPAVSSSTSTTVRLF